MTRPVLAAALAVLLVAGGVRADLAPPPWLKRVVVDHKITTDKEYPGWMFFTVIGETVSAVNLDPKTPIEIKGAGRNGIGRLGCLVAVPKGAEKKYASEKEFHEAIRQGQVEGLVADKTDLDSVATVDATDPRTTIVKEYVLSEIDAKEGIVLKAKDVEKPKDSPDAVWIAGLAGALAVVFAGLWLARRNR